MKAERERPVHAMTLVDVLVIIAGATIFAVIVFLRMSNANPQRQRFCIRNLTQIGLSFKIWAGDNNGKYPMQVPVADGGAKELAAKGDIASVFQVMSNELNTPKILVCPYDKTRTAATNFDSDLSSSNISYFVGIDASTSAPAMFLSGDRNLTNGFAVRNGILDLATNEVVCWTKSTHTRPGTTILGIKFGMIPYGNILKTDGGVMQIDNSQLDQALRNTGIATNRIVIP